MVIALRAGHETEVFAFTTMFWLALEEHPKAFVTV
jgi:hypothetical protein